MSDEKPETSSVSLTCTKCGSRHVIPSVEVIARNGYDLIAVVHANPEATFLKHTVYSPVRARICGDCGYTEFYAAEPATLFDAYSKAAR